MPRARKLELFSAPPVEETMSKRMNLGDLLLALKAVTAQQLQVALEHQRRHGGSLGHVVVELKFCSEATVTRALSLQARLPVVDLSRIEPQTAALDRVDRAVMHQYRVLPLRVSGPRDSVLEIAIAAPGSVSAVDAVREASQCTRVVAYLAMDSELEAAFKKLDGEGLGAADFEGMIERVPSSVRSTSRTDEEPITLGYGRRN
jgi:type IV pilus assembly protein PilB